MVQDESILWQTDRKSYMSYQILPVSITPNPDFKARHFLPPVTTGERVLFWGATCGSVCLCLDLWFCPSVGLSSKMFRFTASKDDKVDILWACMLAVPCIADYHVELGLKIWIFRFQFLLFSVGLCTSATIPASSVDCISDNVLVT